MIYGLEGFNNDSLKETTISYINSIITFFPKIKDRLSYFGFRNEMKDGSISNNKEVNVAYYEMEAVLEGEKNFKGEDIACTVRREEEGDDVVFLMEKAFQELKVQTINDEVISRVDKHFFHSGLQRTTLMHIIAHELGHVILDDYFETYVLDPFVLTVKDKKVSYDPTSEKNKKVIQCINDPITTAEGKQELVKFRAACILALYSMRDGNGECGRYSMQTLVFNNSIEEWMAETISAHFTGGAMDNYMKTFIKLLFHKEKTN
jgi:hypothetical protein